MQTKLADWIKDSPQGLEADSILRKCVHCGFCLATCPTYTLLGDELDSPRGRIYLMKQMLEGAPVTERTQRHLDRCLTCRACETTCPSGVEYGRLVNIGRALVEERVPRKPGDRVRRWLLKSFIPRRGLFSLAVALGRAIRPRMPASLSAKLPARRDPGHPATEADRLRLHRGRAYALGRPRPRSTGDFRVPRWRAGRLLPIQRGRNTETANGGSPACWILTNFSRTRLNATRRTST